jgi:hypothetical protein
MTEVVATSTAWRRPSWPMPRNMIDGSSSGTMGTADAHFFWQVGKVVRGRRVPS